MSSMSWSSRGLLTGMPQGGGTLRVSASDTLVHICIDGNDQQADTLYLYAFVIAHPSPGTPSTIELHAQEKLESTTVKTRISTLEVPAHPHAPTLALNGVVKSRAARIYARAPVADVAVFGFYTRQTLNLVPSARTVVGSLVLASQTVTVSAARESVVLSSSVPISYLVSNHTSETPADAYLGPAADGTMKIITFIAKHPNATGELNETRGNIRLSFNAFRFPAGYEDSNAVGTMLFQRIADSAKLLYSSSIGWSIAGSGVFVE